MISTMQRRVTDYALYRWRYKIGYLFIALTILLIIAIAALYVPGGLRQGEMQSAITSGGLSLQSLDPEMVINLPYHALQRLSIWAFGVTTFSIKLPSIFLGVLTVIGIFVLIRTWFRRNVAVLGTILAVTTTQFLFLIQDGTPAITYSFVTIWLLAAGTYITRRRLFGTFWKVLGCVLLASLLYIPLGPYFVVAACLIIAFHPHIRYVLRKVSRPKIILSVVLGLLSVAPLVYAIIIKPSIALTLLGIPTGPIDLWQNATIVGKDIFGFLLTSNDYLLRPVYSLGVILLMLIGIYKLLTVKYTARSYIVILLSIMIIPLVILNPNALTYLFPIATLLISMGIATMISHWYKLFPRNPYARVAGLIPLAVLVVGIVISGVARYVDNYIYNPNVLAFYNNDLRLLDRTLSSRFSQPDSAVLVTTPEESPFYALVAHYDKRFSVSQEADDPGALILTHDAYASEKPSDRTPSLIVTSRKANDSDRLYIYDPTK